MMVLTVCVRLVMSLFVVGFGAFVVMCVVGIVFSTGGALWVVGGFWGVLVL